MIIERLIRDQRSGLSVMCSRPSLNIESPSGEEVPAAESSGPHEGEGSHG